MPEVKFGRKDEPSLTLEKSDDLIAVRTRSTRPVTAGPVLSAAAAAVDDGTLVLSFPEAGVEVYRVPMAAGRLSLDARKEMLARSPDVRFAGGVLVDEEAGEPVIYTENLFIKFVDHADPDDCRAVLRDAGLTIKKELAYSTNAFFAAAPEGIGTEIFDLALRLLEREDVEYCHPEVVRRREMRQVFPQQWHLRSTTVGGVAVSASANVEAAHQLTLGEGTTIAILDDGVDIDHPELGSAGKVVAPRDATLGLDDPRPKDPDPRFPENHGTACAGVACADGRLGASGVAPRARLLPIRLSSALGSQQEAEAFAWAADHGADVVSCSWGPPDGKWFQASDPLHRQRWPIPASTRVALDYATDRGRGGKGCVILFAAGNGNESVDNDGYASYERVIAVAACNDRGKRSVYSDFGRAIWCAFPSNDRAFAELGHPAPLTPGIWTTDRTGRRGYNPGSAQFGDPTGMFTNDFGGTSSACPGAAGVAALVLSANPSLRWQEVRDILRRSCDRIDPQGGQYDDSGRSAFYGHGRLNAETAVRLARPAAHPSVKVSRSFNQPLPDLQTVRAALEVGETQAIGSLVVEVDLLHTFIGDLVVTLIPPAAVGGAVVLHNRQGGSTRNLKRAYDALTTPGLAGFAGKSPKGTWTLEVKDAAARDTGTLVSFGVELTFAAPVDRGAPRAAPRPAAAARPVRKAEKAGERKPAKRKAG